MFAGVALCKNKMHVVYIIRAWPYARHHTSRQLIPQGKAICLFDKKHPCFHNMTFPNDNLRQKCVALFIKIYMLRHILCFRKLVLCKKTCLFVNNTVWPCVRKHACSQTFRALGNERVYMPLCHYPMERFLKTSLHISKYFILLPIILRLKTRILTGI